MSCYFLDLSYTSMMRLLSFVGRVFFAAIFIQSAYTEFVNWGVEGPEAMAVQPKLDQITARLSLLLGYAVPQIEIKHITGITIALRGLGGLLFIYGSSTGACLLMLYLAFISPMMYDFYNYDIEEPEFFQVFAMFTQNLALFGALLFFIGLNNRTPKRQPKKKGAQRSKKAAPARNHG